MSAQLSLITEKAEERERFLPPAPLSYKEKEEEREAANPEKKKASAQKERHPVVVPDDTTDDSAWISFLSERK